MRGGIIDDPENWVPTYEVVGSPSYVIPLIEQNIPILVALSLERWWDDR